MATALCLGAVIVVAMMNLTRTADTIDAERAQRAATVAQSTLLKQIAGTVRDNAYWDDAFENISHGRLNWAIDNWGETSKDYPLYDTVAVIAPHGGSFMIFYDGKVVPVGAARFFGSSFKALVAKARKAGSDDPVPSVFIRTAIGIAYLAAAPVQAADQSASKTGYVLVFAKHIQPRVISELSDSAGLTDLRLEKSVPKGYLSVPLRDADGAEVARLSWRSEWPGTESLNAVTPLLILAAVGFALFLATILVSGSRVIGTLRRDEALSRRRALFDSLTDLPNRYGIAETFERHNVKSKQLSHSLHLIDLDGFKSVNDLWGHQVGDTLIVAVANRIRGIALERSTVGRVGGDEFVVLLRHEGQVGNWPAMGEMIRAELTRPFILAGHTVELGCSVGQAISTEGDDVFELLRRADIALYKAKEGGRGRTVAFEEKFDREHAAQVELQEELRAAIKNDSIEVLFQPLIDAETRQLRGVEALARWTSCQGPISPEVFIPLAERAGLIDELGMQVLRKSLRAAVKWPGVGLSVNASPIQLRSAVFPSQVSEFVRDAGFDPRLLTVEITEGVLMSDPELASRAITGLRGLGVKVALDDFGSGYASIGTLREYLFDRLKIDRSLLTAVDEKPQAARVLEATIALARALDIPVTAEGVETERQAELLAGLGCDQLQGYYFGRPVTTDRISSMVNRKQVVA